jgi:hypothetical protein
MSSYRAKIDWHIMPLMCGKSLKLFKFSAWQRCIDSDSHVPVSILPPIAMFLLNGLCRITFMDKTTLGEAAVLGILCVLPTRCHVCIR